MNFRVLLLFLLLLSRCLEGMAQAPQRPLRIYLNPDSSSYAGVRVTGQVWMRYNYNNPGTIINGEEANRFFDISVGSCARLKHARIILASADRKQECFARQDFD